MITDLNSLETIEGSAVFINSQVQNLPNLKKVGRYVFLYGSKLNEKDFKNVDVNLGFNYEAP